MINIAILGYGTVGFGVGQVCEMNKKSITKNAGQEVNIKKILDIRDFPDDPLKEKITSNPDEIFNDPEITVVVETIGGTDVAYDYTLRAFDSGKSVVTSNKELVAKHGPELLEKANKKKLSYLFEASVGGGIPIIRPLIKSFSSERVISIYGILNGTTNYILTKMEKDSVSFDEALNEARELGFAEQNPKEDIEGMDACRKLAILSSLATGEFIDYRNIYTEGIEKITYNDIKYAAFLNNKIKLLAGFKIDENNCYEAFVYPALLSGDNPITVAEGVYNAILVDGSAVGSSMFYGKGAGQMATASAVVSDIIEAVLHNQSTPHTVLWEKTGNIKMMSHGECKVRALIRIKGDADTKGIISKISKVSKAERIKKIFDDETAVILGYDGKLTEDKLSEILEQIPDVISAVRIV